MSNKGKVKFEGNEVNVEKSLNVEQPQPFFSEKEKARLRKFAGYEAKFNELKKIVNNLDITRIPAVQIIEFFKVIIENYKIDDIPLINEYSQIFILTTENKIHKGVIKDLFDFARKNNLNESHYFSSIKKISLIQPIFNNFYTEDFEKSCEEFFENNEIIEGQDLYEKISKGLDISIDEIGGLINTGLEKAKRDLSKYKQVKKLIVRNGTVYIATLYVRNGVFTDDKSALMKPASKNVQKLALEYHVEEGTDVNLLDANGNWITGEVVTVADTAKGSGVYIKLANGKKITKSFDKFFAEVNAGKIVVTLAFTRSNTTGIAQSNVPIVNTNLSIKSLNDLKPIRVLNGSTNPTLSEDATGRQYVVKKGGAAGQSLIENLASNIYNTLGVETAKGDIVEGAYVTNFLGNVKGIDTISSTDPMYNIMRDQMHSTFVAHALLANWDIVENDNTMYDGSGKIYAIDNGGALSYRATGGKKGTGFSEDVTELNTMRISSNAQIKWFGSITDGDIAAQIQNYIIPNKANILSVIKADNNISASDKKDLLKIMEGRIDYLEKWLDKYNKRPGKNNPIVTNLTSTVQSISGSRDNTLNYQDLDLEELKDEISNARKNKNSGKSSNFDSDKGFIDFNLVATKRGFDQRPIVLSDKDFDKFMLDNAGKNQFKLAYRTVSSDHEDSFREKTEFYTGGYGMSAYGAGIYCAVEDVAELKRFKHIPPPPQTAAWDDSRSYGKSGGKNTTHYMMFCDTFKWIDYRQASQGYYDLVNRVNGKQTTNPAYQKREKEHKDKLQELQSFTKDYVDNFAKNFGYNTDVEDYLVQKHQVRDWNTTDIPVMINHLKKANATVKTNKSGAITVIMPASLGGATVTYDPAIIGTGRGKSYDLEVKKFFNNIYDGYVSPFSQKKQQAASTVVNDPTYKKISDEASQIESVLKSTPQYISVGVSKEDKAMYDIIKNHTADEPYGMYALLSGYDGVDCGRYHTVFNRSKTIVRQTDYVK